MLPTRLVGRALTAGSVRVGSRGVVNHGPHVTASGCRHDDWQRGSERFFHPSPTKKRPDVEQARWARGPRRAAAGYDQAPCPRPGFRECPLTSGGPPGLTAHQWESVRGGAAVLRASGASVVAGGPARGSDSIGVPRGWAPLAWGSLGEPRRHPSRPVGAEKIAVVLFE